MANITRFDPFAELAPMGSDLFKGLMLQPFFRGADMEPQIRMDISEDDKAYTIKAEIPGVSKDDIKISIDGNILSISAEMKKESEEKEGKKVVRRERYFGRVSRSLSLDEDVDQGSAQARYQDGVLQLTLPKKPGAQSRTIKIS
ncbi:MAG: heat shock protein Hsp20 [Rhodocyclaceae bacterium]|nr:heat shock protein Hsp20 [Rhodocyclaceae bacterium]